MFTVTDHKISENIKIKSNSIKSQKKDNVSNISTPSKNINKMHTCKICDYTTSRKYNLNKHMLSKKHKKRAEPPKKVAKNDPKKVAKNSGEKSNICKNIICNDNPSQKNSEENVEKNPEILSSKKAENPKKVAKIAKKVAKISEKVAKKYSCECGKIYKYRQTLYVHRKKCDFEKKRIEMEKEMEKKMEKKMNAELDKRLNEQMEIYTEIIKNEVIPNIQQSVVTNNNNTINNNNTTNNNFNLNIFLNETCKDAINMTEFIENLKVGLQELEFVRKNGIVKGISNVFVNELNALDVDKRPIHCTDIKRKTLYIKDDNKWDKQDKKNNKKIDRSIQCVKKKHVDSIRKWEEENPNWCNDEKLAMEYLRMARNSTTPIDEMGEKRILSDISTQVDISDIKNKDRTSSSDED